MPFGGPCKAIMLNWLVDAVTARREALRHTVLAGVKSLFGI
jgi:hypothetical protein